MSWPIFKVDAFATRPFGGNPAGVCLLERAEPAEWMQAVAAEMNVAETAFLVARPEGFDLRWFTPRVEVDLCGHATLASAHVLWSEGRLDPAHTARFHTRSGLLTARRDGAAIAMDFPALPVAPAEPPSGLGAALGVTPIFVGRSRMDYLVEVAEEADVRAARPDIAQLATLPVRGTILTARAAGGEHDFVSRFFAPAAGVDEDPVTGSAHCALAPYWASKLGRARLVGYQASARGGVVRCAVEGERVVLGGSAITVLRGTLL